MATGDILSVTIGVDGWYADVTIEGATTGGSYSFGLGVNNNPISGTPKVTFTVVSLGFDATGAPTTVTRTVYGTKQVRKPAPNESVNEEAASGGNVTVRVALSDYIYAKDAVGAGNSGIAPTVTIAAAFYTSGGSSNNAVAGLVVNNGSTFAYLKVVGNWTQPGYDKLGATFTLRATAFHSSAGDGKPVQCIKFTATDAGANTATTTVVAPSVDAAMGDPVPVVEYVGTLSAAALTQGSVVTCHFIAYPRVGDTAACLDTSLGTAQPTPLYGPQTAVCDKTGAYAPSAVVVDVVAGNDAAGAVTDIFDSASPPAAYATMAAAFNALRSFNNTTYGRNNCGGSVMYLKEGTHPWVNGSIVAGTTPDAWLTVTKFPTVTRGNVIIGDQIGGQNLGTRMKLSNIKYTGQKNIGNISGASHLWLDNCEIDCPPVGKVAFYEILVLYFTRCLVTSLDQGFHPFSNVNSPPGLIRGNTVVSMGRQILAYTVVGNALLASVPIYDFYSGMLSPESVNTVVAYNKINGAIGSNTPLMLRQGTADTHGGAVIQNLIEITENSSLPAFQYAADLTTLTPVNNALVWHNVVIGQRASLAYNEVGTTLAVRLGWSVKNNIFDDINIKSDTFPTAATARVGNWSVLYGCGCSGNLHAETMGMGAAGAFLFEMSGVKSYQPIASGQPPAGTTNVIGFIGYVDRQSYNGSTNGAGGGDYHLTAGSPARALQHDYVLLFDLAGAPRWAADGSGVYTAVAPLGFVTGTAQLYPVAGIKRHTLEVITESGVVTAPTRVKRATLNQVDDVGTLAALNGKRIVYLGLVVTGSGVVWPLTIVTSYSWPPRVGTIVVR